MEICPPALAESVPAGHVRLAAVQMEPRIGALAHNLAHSLACVAAAARRRAALVVFPECSLTGYCFADREEALAAALEPDAAPLAALAAACREHRVATVVGYLERRGDELGNALALIDGTGVLARYHKTHLPHLGVDRWVRAGCEALAVHEAGELRLGMLICYDGSFPEAARTLALRGADLIVLPTNWPQEALLKADWLPNTRAYENVVYFAAVNRVGNERGFAFHGKSRICDPTGATLVQAPADREVLMLADLDPVRARTKKIQRRPDYWVDRIAQRRPELYDPGLIRAQP